MALPIDPLDDPEAFDHVVIAGYRTPGKCLVEGFERENDYDIKVGKGTAGATETLKGQPPAKGKITFWTWTAEQRAAWTPIIKALTFKPSKQGTSSSPAANPAAPPQFTGTVGGAADRDPKGSAIPAPGNTTGKPADTSAKKPADPPPLTKNDALEIYYPTLADVGVNYVLPPDKLGIWEPEGGDYTYMKRVISFVEFTQVPAANIATTPTGAKDGSNDPALVGSGGQGPPAGKQEGAAPPAAKQQQNNAAKDGQNAWGTT